MSEDLNERLIEKVLSFAGRYGEVFNDAEELEEWFDYAGKRFDEHVELIRFARKYKERIEGLQKMYEAMNTLDEPACLSAVQYKYCKTLKSVLEGWDSVERSKK